MKVKTNKAGEYFARFEDVQSHGALSGTSVEGLTSWDSGRLNGEDLERFRKDCEAICYVIRSYATPIAWFANGKWYKVKQKFSVTTSKHQGQLWRLKEQSDERRASANAECAARAAKATP